LYQVLQELRQEQTPQTMQLELHQDDLFLLKIHEVQAETSVPLKTITITPEEVELLRLAEQQEI
jgi:hypothetical protein